MPHVLVTEAEKCAQNDKGNQKTECYRGEESNLMKLYNENPESCARREVVQKNRNARVVTTTLFV